jgi:hypothetical protein
MRYKPPKVKLLAHDRIFHQATASTIHTARGAGLLAFRQDSKKRCRNLPDGDDMLLTE